MEYKKREYDLAENLYNLRKERGLSQKEMAEFLGIKQAAYSKYETGESEPKISTLIKLARYYETDLNRLIGFLDFTPYENAVKRLQYSDPSATVKKEETDKVTCCFSRQSENVKLENHQYFVTEQDFVSCASNAHKNAIKELEEHYKDRFIMFFAVNIALRQLERLKAASKAFNSKDFSDTLEDSEKALKIFAKKSNIPANKKRKTRSDKTGGEK